LFYVMGRGHCFLWGGGGDYRNHKTTAPCRCAAGLGGVALHHLLRRQLHRQNGSCQRMARRAFHFQKQLGMDKAHPHAIKPQQVCWSNHTLCGIALRVCSRACHSQTNFTSEFHWTGMIVKSNPQECTPQLLNAPFCAEDLQSWQNLVV